MSFSFLTSSPCVVVSISVVPLSRLAGRLFGLLCPAVQKALQVALADSIGSLADPDVREFSGAAFAPKCAFTDAEILGGLLAVP